MNSLWQRPPGCLVLSPDEVHAWRAALDCPPPQIEAFFSMLAKDERQRAERFVFEKDRNRFVACRGVLRAILSRYLGAEPQHFRFQYSPFGKPSLMRPFEKNKLCFNVSHSHGLAVIGLSYGREIGVDLEYIRRNFADERIAELFFSAREVRALRALPKDLQDEAFFNCWTRKEAYIKGKGEGLSMPLHLFDVSLAPDEPAALLGANGDELETARWVLRELSPAPGFVGTVAAEGQGWELKCWEWEIT